MYMANPLARAVMKNVVRDRVGNRPYTRNTNNVQEEKVGNLTSRQVELVKELIHGNREVKNHTSMGKKHTLDELAAMIKKNL